MTLDTLGQHRLLPIIVIDDAAQAAPLADALLAGELPVAEITLRTPAAEAAIRTIAQRGDITIGAGTVLSIDLASVRSTPARTSSSRPDSMRKWLTIACGSAVPITPGVATCTEIEFALERGVSVVKFFPAESIGGAKALCAISAISIREIHSDRRDKRAHAGRILGDQAGARRRRKLDGGEGSAQYWQV